MCFLFYNPFSVYIGCAGIKSYVELGFRSFGNFRFKSYCSEFQLRSYSKLPSSEYSFLPRNQVQNKGLRKIASTNLSPCQITKFIIESYSNCQVHISKVLFQVIKFKLKSNQTLCQAIITNYQV